MTVRTGGERSSRVVESGEGPFRALVAWRGRASDRALLYFLALDADAPDPDDRRDRRAPLGPGREPGDLSEEDLLELLAEAAPLTGTERRFRAPDGRLWLAQSIGPVWADEEPAEGSTGLLFTSLEGASERLRAPGAHAGALEEAELADLWRRAGADLEEDGGDGEADAGDGGDGAGDGTRDSGEADAEDDGET